MHRVLVTNKICPFAHRAWITLRQKNVEFELKQVSLTNKEAFFTQTYKKAFGHDPKSDGKVPILIDGEKYLTESDLISWYVAETFNSGNQLIPKDPFEKAKLRYFIQNIPGKVIEGFYGYMGFSKKTEEQKLKTYQKLISGLEVLNQNIVGPYALGAEFTLGDIMVYPWLERFVVLEKIFNISIPEKFNKVHQLIKAIQERPSVKQIRQDPQFFIDGYKPYFQK